MSAFIVRDKTINRVVTWMAEETRRNPYFAQKIEQGLLLSTDDNLWEAKLAQAMFQLNIDGVNARYGLGEAQKFKTVDFTYQSEYARDKVQVIKSLQCWLYQCCEGRIMYSPMYRFFDEWVVRYLMSQIIDALPTYNKAEWG